MPYIFIKKGITSFQIKSDYKYCDPRRSLPIKFDNAICSIFYNENQKSPLHSDLNTVIKIFAFEGTVIKIREILTFSSVVILHFPGNQTGSKRIDS